MADSKDISVTALRECFEADFKSGMLFWRERPLDHFPDQRAWKIFNTQFAGKRAGTAQMKRGYHVINFNGAGTILVHRIIWALAYGRWPKQDIDHVNGNPSDNSLVNLREATASQNGFNAKRRTDNSSGHRGVSFDPKRGRWRAYLTVDGRTRWLGYHSTYQEASAAYEQAAQEAAGAFYRRLQ